jgi:hypothetical protein
MIKFENYFKVLLTQKHISEASLLRFLEDHLHRLMSNNPDGKYDALIAALTLLFDEYRAAIYERNLNQALQESMTKTVDRIISDFKKQISRKEHIILDIWDIKSPEYKEFYPRGLDEYSRATKGNTESLLARFNATCELHCNDLPDGFADKLIALQASYVSNRAEQLRLIGATDGNRFNVAEKRKAVVKQVTKNLLLIAVDFLDEPEMVKVYFDQSIVRRPEKKKTAKQAPEIFSEAVPPETKAVIIHGGFEAATSFHIVNTGSVTLQFYSADMPNDTVPGHALELPPGEEEIITASKLGASGNLFLMVHNPSANLAGSYKVSIGEEN